MFEENCKNIISVIIIELIVIQFFRPAKNSFAEIPENQIMAGPVVPENVQNILKASCYDCHSNTTVYPWYWHTQPSAWFLDNHIKDGKRHLNFSEFATYPASKQYKKLREIGKELKEGDMPLGSYTLIHRSTSLNAGQKQLIEDWADVSIKKMEEQYPADSLTKR